MSTKKSARKIEHKSLVHVLEDCVLALESQGQTEQDIFSLVNMIMRGFIVNGELTEEYKMLAQKAMEYRARGSVPEAEPIRTILTDTSGNPLMR